MAHVLGNLAAWAAKHWKRSLAIVAVVLVALGLAAGAAGGSFVDDFRTPGTDRRARWTCWTSASRRQSGDTANVVFAVDSGTLRDPERRAAIERTVEEIRAQPHVTAAPSPFAKDSGRLSEDARIAYVPVQYDDTAPVLGKEPGERLEQASEIGDAAGLEVSRNGAIVDQAEQTTAPVGELIGVAVAMIVLTLVFRSVAAMALTLISALIALAGGLLLLQFASAFADFPSFAPTLGVMFGLGAGIDYALLIVGRYREQLASGDSVAHAARVANATAGTSVVAAGAIVVVAITGLLATGIPFVGQMGIGSAIIIAMVAVGAVTVLPTLMGAFARRLRPKRPEHVEPSQRFARWAGVITRRPLVAAIAGALVLVLLAVPFASLRLGQPDDGNDRAGSTTRVAYDRLAEGFGPGFNGPLVLAATTPADGSGKTTLSRIQQAVAEDPDVAFVSPPQPSPARRRRRPERDSEELAPGRAHHRAGRPAARRRAPRRHARLAGERLRWRRHGDAPGPGRQDRRPAADLHRDGRRAELLLLMAVFRSLSVPLVSAAFNLLSIAAAYGVVVLVFQNGFGSSLLGVDGEVPIVSFVPLFMFAILFGLSMDYNVFLQSRIPRGVHARRRTGAERRAGDGARRQNHPRCRRDHDQRLPRLRHRPRGGRQDDGLGLAAAILIDVLVVRMVVAPAVMTLLGDRAWTLPAWLDRLLPRISLEGDLKDSERLPEPVAAA